MGRGPFKRKTIRTFTVAEESVQQAPLSTDHYGIRLILGVLCFFMDSCSGPVQGQHRH